MPSLAIPRAYWSGFEVLANLTDDEFGTVLQALTEAETSPRVRGLASYVSERVPARDLDDIRELIDSLVSVYGLQGDMGIPVDLIAGWIAEDVEETDGIDKPEDWNQEAYAQRLVAALQTDKALRIAAKGLELLGEYPNRLCTARIITDVRPLFEDDVSESPQGSMLVHQLKIRYHAGDKGEIEEFFVALKADDLELLKEAVRRAELKAESLRTHWKDAKITPA